MNYLLFSLNLQKLSQLKISLFKLNLQKHNLIIKMFLKNRMKLWMEINLHKIIMKIKMKRKMMQEMAMLMEVVAVAHLLYETQPIYKF